MRERICVSRAGLRETEYYSKRIGEVTICTHSHTTNGKGEARRPLMTPNEVRIMPEHTVLTVPVATLPLLLKIRPYYDNRCLARLANLPYHST